MSNPYEAPVVSPQWALTKPKLVNVDGELFIGLLDGDRVIALIEPEAVENELRHYRRAKLELTR